MWEGNREDGEKDTNDRHLQARFSSHSVQPQEICTLLHVWLSPGLVYLQRHVCSGSQCNVYLLARLLHLEHPAGTVVVVGVAVVLHVG